MLTLENSKKSAKTFFGNGGWLATARTTSYEIAEVAKHLANAPENLTLVLNQSSLQHNFPAARTGQLLLVDESLGLPVTLATALQMATLYEGLEWADAISQQCAAMDFLQEFLELFLPEALKLLTLHRLGLNLAEANLLVITERGKPMSVELREVGGWNFTSVTLAGFEATTNRDEFYASFRAGLLNQNLRPLISRLATLTGANPDILWDTAINALFQALAALPTDVLTKERARLALMVEELDMGERLRDSNFSPLAATASGLNPFAEGGLIYLKRKCCKKYKKNKRCSDCPGRAKKG